MSGRLVRAYLVCVALVALSASAVAQNPFSFVTWRSIGPVNTAGRIDDIAVARVRGEADAIYIATATGGLWKSANEGISFAPVFDHVNAMMSIGAVAVAPSSPLTVWLGTGEANTRQSSSWGDGVYKSTDGGRTWAAMGLRDTRAVGRIVIDPRNMNTVFVAAQGHLFGPNAERGVFKTTDGGQTWKKVLYVDEFTGANDIVIDPENPEVLYAAMYQHMRRTWGFNGGGPGSGIYKSSDGGDTWTKLTEGLPAGDKGRIGLSLYTADPRVVYATIEAGGGTGGIYRTLDAGATWERTSTLDTRPNYYSEIRVDPKDRQHVYTLGSNRGFYYSNDGGKTFTELFSNVHGEDHALWIDPDSPNHFIIGGDGGVSISWDRGHTWDFRRNMPIGQFYEVDVDNSVPFRVCGGLQDNGVWCVPSAVRDRNGIADRDAWNIGGGDGFHAHFDPANPSMVIQSSQNGNVAWVNIETLEHQGVRPGTGERPAVPAGGRGGRGGRGAAAGEAEFGGGGGGGRGGNGYRFNWDTPIAVSHHDPHTWFMGAQYLFKSTDRGSTWIKISPDLTLDVDRDTLKLMGKVVGPDALSRNDGQSSYGSLTSIGESPLDPKVIYTGSDDGQVQLTRDGGKTWTDITHKIAGVPDQTYVSTVLPSRHKASRVYVTFDGHYTDDYKPYVFVSDDFGQTWSSLAAGLPETSINRIREHPTDPGLLVLAHERGVHFSNDGGATWYPLTTNLPTVPVDDAIFQERDNALVIGTHGRGIWILDDVGPLQALTADALKADALLVPPAHAHLMSTYTPQAWYGAGEHFSLNPEWDAVIQYHLRAGTEGIADITIADASGKTIRTLKGSSATGMNRVVWDLRYAPPVDSANAPAGGRGFGGGRGGPPAATPVGFPAGGEGGRGGPPVGPLVMPGRYSVTVKVPGVATPLTGSVVVEGDPITHFSAADRATRQAVLMRIYDWMKALGDARLGVRSLLAQRETMRSDLAGDTHRADSLLARVQRLSGEIDRAFTALNAQHGPIEGWSGVPTIDQQKAVGYGVDDAEQAGTEFNALVGKDIPAAYQEVAKKAWPQKVGVVAFPAKRAASSASP